MKTHQKSEVSCLLLSLFACEKGTPSPLLDDQSLQENNISIYSKKKNKKNKSLYLSANVFSAEDLLGKLSRSNWSLEILVFEKGKPKNPEESLSEEGREPTTNLTYDAESRNRTLAALVRGECSYHCALPAPLILWKNLIRRLK